MSQIGKFFESHPTAPRIAVSVFLVLFAIGLAVGLSQLFTAAASEVSRSNLALTNVASQWQAKLATRVSEGLSLAAAAGAFVLGEAPAPIDLNSSVAERAQSLNATRWATLAPTLFSSVPGMFSLQLQPGCVINQGWPAGSFPALLDNWNRPAIRPSILYMIQLGRTYVEGPIALVQGGWGYVSRFPVFLNPRKEIDSFWGLTACVFRITDVLATFNATQYFAAAGYDWLVYRIDNTNASRPPDWITGTRGLDNATWLRTALSLPCPVIDPTTTLFIAVKPSAGLPSGVPPAWAMATVVVVSLVGALLVTITMFGIVYAQWASADANRNAPTAPPLCLLFTDIESSTDMWRAHPEAMAKATDVHHAVIRRAIEEHGAYEVKTIGDSFMIACKDGIDGVMLALSIQKCLNEAPWPSELNYALIGKEKPSNDAHLWRGLRVRIGLHYASDVEPKFDSLKRYWDYYGNDVNCCARLEAAAEGGQILVTAETLQYLKDSGEFDDMVAPESVVALYKGGYKFKGIDQPFDLYSITPSSLAGRVFTAADAITEKVLSGSDRLEHTLHSHETSTQHGGGDEEVGKGEALSVLKMAVAKLQPKDRPLFVQMLKAACNVTVSNQNRALNQVAAVLATRA